MICKLQKRRMLILFNRSHVHMDFHGYGMDNRLVKEATLLKKKKDYFHYRGHKLKKVLN